MSDGVEQFHEVLRAAVITRGLSLERIAAHLRARGHTVSIATLSYWQSGRSLPSRATSLRALGALETVLGIPRGALARLAPLPPGQDTASAPKPALTDILRQRSRIDEVLASMGRSLDAGVDLVANHTCAYVDQSGQVPSVLCREVLVATDDRVDSYLLAAGHPVSGIDVVFTPVSGCRMHGHIADAADSWGIADMALPPLRRGEIGVIEYEMGFQGLPVQGVERSDSFIGLVSPIREIYLQVTFEADAAPPEMTRLDGLGDDVVRTTAPMTSRTVTVARQNVGPGTLGFEWSTTSLGPLPERGPLEP